MSAQSQTAETRIEPNCIQRNNDFQNRRIGDTYVNFAREYYLANLSLTHVNGTLSKKAELWTPRGPFGKERLAGTGRVNSIQFHPTDTNTWFICVAQGGVWKTTNGGASWTSVSGDLPILRTSCLAINPEDPDEMYVALGDFAYLGHNLQANENKRTSHYGLGVYKTTDGGAHWSPTALSFELDDFEGSLISGLLINRSNTSHVIATGQTGSFVSTDGGATWTQTSDKLFWDLEQDPVADSVLYATTGYVHSYRIGEASILKSTDFGNTWSVCGTPFPLTAALQRIELAIAPSDNRYIYAIACDTLGGFYGFYQSTDAGDTFIQKSDYTYEYNILSGGFSASPGGQGWYDLAICVDKENKNTVLTGGINIWQTTDGGASFTPVTYWTLNYQKKSLHADIHQILQRPGDRSFFVAHDGGISRSYNIIPNTPEELMRGTVGTEWAHYTDGLNITSFYRLGVNQSRRSQVMAGAQDNSTVFGDGTRFSNLSGGDGMEALFYDEINYRYTSSQNGLINVYALDGDTFKANGTIRPPVTEQGEWTTPFVAANGKIYLLYGNLYTAKSPFLDDKLTDFPDIGGFGYPKKGTALAVERDNANHIYIAKRGYASLQISNDILASADGGKTWSDIGAGLPRYLYPSYLEMSHRSPSKVWISFSGFDSSNKIFYSSNSGVEWHNITYDLPNVPVNCLVSHNDAILYAGTDMGVFYLMKDSTSWVYYSDGLPKVIVSELEIDQSNQTLVAATFGRGIWEVDLAPNNDSSALHGSMPASIPRVTVSPNPTSSFVDVQLTGMDIKNLSLRIIDITGRVLIDEAYFDVNKKNGRIDVSGFLPGEYFVILSDGDRRSVSRFIKM